MYREFTDAADMKSVTARYRLKRIRLLCRPVAGSTSAAPTAGPSRPLAERASMRWVSSFRLLLFRPLGSEECQCDKVHRRC